jgi:hypothetical protein
MDADMTILKSSGLSVGVVGLLYIAIRIVKTLNNKRIHSKCNGKDILDIVIDVHQATTEEKNPTPKASPVIKPADPEKQPPELNYIV